MTKFTFRLITASAILAGGLFAVSVPAEARDRNPVSFSVTLGNVQFAYTDGYYDNNRRWHSWRNDNERSWYYRNHRRSYYNMRRDNDRDCNRRNWRNGRGNDRDCNRRNWRNGRGNDWRRDGRHN
ncbi:MAG: hypothetical protein ABL973_09615 [Micropepsaceae bacterium]